MGGSPPSWWEHVDLMQIVLVGCIGYFVWSFRSGIKDFKDTIRDLYGKYNDLKGEFDTLKGEHNERSCDRRCSGHPGRRKEDHGR